jgi:hypothetical protein
MYPESSVGLAIALHKGNSDPFFCLSYYPILAQEIRSLKAGRENVWAPIVRTVGHFVDSIIPK